MNRIEPNLKNPNRPSPSLLSAPLMLKLFFGRTFLSTIAIRPQNGILWGKVCVNVKFWFCDPLKAHPCAEQCLFKYFALLSMVASWL